VDFASLPDFPEPSHTVGGTVTSAGGVRIRFARWRPTVHRARGTVCLLQGRSEFIEKYFEVVAELRRRGFYVVTFDWRGQGGSQRLLAEPRKGHIDDFDEFIADLDAIIREVVRPHCPGPTFALAHSMGAAVLLRALHDRPTLFERVVLTAPLIEIAGLRYPRGAHALAAVLDVCGFGGSFVPGGGETSLATKPFAGNRLTADPRRYSRTADLVAAAPRLGLGDPTVGWVHAAFRALAPFRDPNYPLAIPTPILLIAGTDDAVTLTPAAERFAARLKTGRALIFRGARHEILMEIDAYRDQFWAAFDAFIPGTAPGDVLPARHLQDADALRAAT
jgi:lysophospholipase